MTYHTYAGDSLSGYKYEHDGAPQTFMMLDIAALQEMYGADYTTNSDNTVYKWNPNQGITYVNGVAAITPAANRIFATIWDGGGIDTYDLSAYTTGLKIDLRAGGHSVFSQGQLADLGGGPNNGYARGNIFNALLYHGNVASLIENVQAGSGNDSIIGNEADNTLWGNAGNDSLSGGSGNDTLIGGTGNDTYIVDDLADVVTEELNQGTDLIRTALSSFALTNIANVENLTFTGTVAFTGTGNGLANSITGGAGNDLLDGGAGNDTLIGGAGNDIYVVDADVDFVVESANKGTDTVRTALSSYTLSNNVENLIYTGSASFTGTGNALANSITGGAGNDVLDGGAGADTLIGGAGDDTYVVDNASDNVAENASAGTDTVRTTLASYTLGANIENLTNIGTAVFTGTGNSLANTIKGAAGADTLDGKAGADILIGGAGNDTYIVDLADVVTEGVNEGTDLIKTALSSYALTNIANVENLTYTGSASFTGTGNALANAITGAAGNDVLDGGAGNDTLNGGAGNDIYVVDSASDIVTELASAGTDEIRTSLATYSIAALINVENLSYTGSASFTGTGNTLANRITGGAGNDMLNGGAGADTLIGGAGDDTYIVDNAGDSVTENAAAGTDTVRTALAAYTLGANVENLTYIGTVAFAGTGNSFANTITGGVGNDTLDGAAGADILIGGVGNDTYIVDNAGDSVAENAAAGTDTVKTVLANYTLGNNVENLTYTGSADFTGTGNALANMIIGGAGNDLLDGGAGNDTLNGGAGNDIYVVDSASDIVTELASAGTDEIRTSLAAYSIAALINVENLSYTGSANFTGTGNALDNTITGGAGNDTLNGAVGADTLIGGAGDDTYIVDNAGDSVAENAAAGTDTVRTTLASYTLDANVENLTYIGIGTAAFAGTGNDLDNVITGAAAADTLSGGDGNDTLNGGAGADSLIGGAGDDTYIVDNAGDSVAENADEGTDTVKTVLASYTLGVNVENLTYIGTAAFTGTGNDLANTITGGVGNDALNGGAGADTMIGGAGNDTYIVDNAGDSVAENAAAGTDTVKTVLANYTLGNNVENLIYTGSASFTGTGNALANTIIGGAGNDLLDGGAGNDTLIGGAGNDIYVVDSATDIVTELASAGTDEIRTSLAAYSIAALINVENLSYTGSANFIGTGNALANMITGSAGHDMLNGGAGADSLIGGDGDDTYIVDNAGDLVTEAADEGTDTVRTTLASYTLGSDLENLAYIGTLAFAGTGNDLDNVITGGAAIDTLSGGAGNDTLNGGAGADTMIGGTGDDTYVVDNAGDSVTENAAAGTDTVRTILAAYTLGANVENLTYIGTAAFVGTGNSLANTITGGVGNDTLNGAAGADILIGGAGSDTYIVDDLADVVTEGVNEGTDLIRTMLSSYALTSIANVENLAFIGTGDFIGTGNALANTIIGGAGNDLLDGGTGNDTLNGGAGNDIYVVDSAGDVINEAVNAGTDEIRTVLAAYSIAALVNVENLSYTGSANFTGTGNALANTITGGAGSDMLNGGAGADSLIGGEGSDTYIVDNAGDLVTEAADEGTDTVRTTLASYTLGSDLENLTYIGTAAFTGTGNSLDNMITGGVGNDTLNGAAGADILIGGAGNDTYIVDNDGDVVTEGLNEGGDLIKTALSSYALTINANVEHLSYTGSASFTATGNALANRITGGVGNDLLDGGAGNDTLIGGAGNDIYVVDSASDVVTELASAGTDEIRTALAAYSIAALVNVENLTYTGSANFTGTGNALANTITGGAGTDMLNGGAGADSLIGGAGSDTYIIDNAGDLVTEAADEGIDTVRTTLVSYTLGSDVENLAYIGTVAFIGTGNSLDNAITGGAAIDTLSGGVGNDMLNGGAGADRLIGGTGDDTYIVDNSGDLITEAANEGIDTARTNLSAYTLGANVENLTYIGTATFVGTGNLLDNVITGGVGADSLAGAAGNDTLIGGGGSDKMSGGVGDDVYVVDIATDIVIENANEGIDIVHTALSSYTLGNNVENLTYTGSVSFTGAGNALANTITGGAGNDVLNGGAGADTLIGGAGNDTYIVDNAGDIVTEAADAGTDTVRTNLAAYTLGTNVENLTYIGSGPFAGTGNALNNVIVGGSGSNALTGGAGDDTLTGGAAADVFVFLLNWGHDTITNFVATGTAHDTIRIDHSIFADWESLFAASSQYGNDTIVTADIDNTIVLRNVALTSLDSGDFLFA
ncbi:Ca2+-binding RTX toxin-like protein [Rhizobium esperanzae]|uniref:Ca2+-binding RTX toxin-like protein n=2 Tax=Rhizobium/Agrobacterium group TaxID=227290 RepID=A0A7W6UK12_9HYPH|nr:Ca2+-binding RTX toxin-like protein [Rhizobium esperanzae]